MRIFTLVLVFLLSNNIFSQILKGKIIDQEGKSIRDASISISNENLCYTNNSGKFNVKLNNGVHMVSINHLNYKNKTIKINLNDNQTKKLNITLERKINLLDDVEIIEEKSGIELAAVTFTKLDKEVGITLDIVSVLSLALDIVR